MNINPNSWYHKIFGVFDANVPHNLCPYARKVIMLWLFAIGATVGIAFITAILGTAVIGGVLQLLGLDGIAYLKLENLSITQLAQGLAAGTATITAILGAIYGCVVAHVKISECLKERRNGRPSLTYTIRNSDNIIVKYVSAKHNKICPRLTFRDKE